MSVLTITSSHSRHTGRGNQMKVITDEQSGSRPFGLLGWNPWDSVGCGPAAVVCRPLRKTRGLQSVRCVLRAEGGKPGRKQHQQWTNNEVHLHRPQQPLPDAAAAVPRVSHQCFCSPTGYLWSLGSSGSCSSRKVRTQSACWLGSEVCAETNHRHIENRFNSCSLNMFRPVWVWSTLNLSGSLISGQILRASTEEVCRANSLIYNAAPAKGSGCKQNPYIHILYVQKYLQINKGAETWCGKFTTHKPTNVCDEKGL